jgi:hypothetical protein
LQHSSTLHNGKPVNRQMAGIIEISRYICSDLL